jgi:hypothetical protein
VVVRSDRVLPGLRPVVDDALAGAPAPAHRDRYLHELAESRRGAPAPHIRSASVGGDLHFCSLLGRSGDADRYNRGIINAGLVSFPRWALLFVIPLGFGTAAIEFARGAWRDLLGRGPSGDESNSVSAA